MPKKNKYSGLVKNGIITEDDLNSALSLASSESKDIELIFLNELKLSREDIGKSLELFYNVPYQTYDGSSLPEGIFSGLNKKFLKRNNWVPLVDDEDKVIILIDDPSDEDKIENIPQKFSKKILELRVGLKSDIHDFLNGSASDQETIENNINNGASSSVTSLIVALAEASPEPPVPLNILKASLLNILCLCRLKNKYRGQLSPPHR